MNTEEKEKLMKIREDGSEREEVMSERTNEIPGNISGAEEMRSLEEEMRITQSLITYKTQIRRETRQEKRRGKEETGEDRRRRQEEIVGEKRKEKRRECVCV